MSRNLCRIASPTSSPFFQNRVADGVSDGRARLPHDVKLFTERIRLQNLVVSNADAPAEPVPACAAMTGSIRLEPFRVPRLITLVLAPLEPVTLARRGPARRADRRCQPKELECESLRRVFSGHSGASPYHLRTSAALQRRLLQATFPSLYAFASNDDYCFPRRSPKSRGPRAFERFCRRGSAAIRGAAVRCWRF